MTSFKKLNSDSYRNSLKDLENKELKQRIDSIEKHIDKPPQVKSKLKQGTARQICLSFHYLRKAQITPRKSGINLVDGEFMSFITGLSTDNLRNLIENPFEIKGEDEYGRKTKSLLDDLNKVRFQFKNIHFSEGLELIDNDIRVYENTIKSYKTDE
jgi:hypothetical protein